MKQSTIFLYALLAVFSIVPLAAQSQRAAKPVQSAPRVFRWGEPDQAWVARTLKGLTLRDKIAQLIAVRIPGRFLNRKSPEYLELETEVRKNRVGGVILFAGNVYESAVLINDLQKIAQTPLLVSGDFERGVSFRISDTTSFPWTMAIGASGSEELAFQEGAVTAREARALGVHWIYAPVMDVNNNPDNPVINIRSYGEDPALVARLGAAFIRGAREGGVLTTAKHFPGHGDTATDTHIGLATVSSSRERLDAVELVPFRGAIAAGVDAIMSGHLAVPELTGEKSVPATLSPKILTDLLRESLQFKGFVVTDAMEMGGITSRYWTGQAAVRALQAGADMLLLPPDTEVAINEIVRAVGRGDLKQERIDRSVTKVLAAKTRFGLQIQRAIPLDRIAEVIASPQSQKLAQTIADRSVTLVRDELHLLPVNPLRSQRIFSLALSSELDASPGAGFQTEMRRRFSTVTTMSADVRITEDLISTIVRSASEADLIVCATIVRVISGKGSLGLPEAHQSIIRKLLATGKPVALVAFGSPYVLRAIPQVQTFLCTYSYADVSQIAAARAFSGDIAVSGNLPVAIPGIARAGDGLKLSPLNMTLSRSTPADLGLPQDAFSETEKLLQSYVEKKAFPGVALIVGYKGSVALDASAGNLDYSPGSSAVSGDTIYDLASLSKAIATTSAAMMLVDSGRLLLDAAVQDYLPEFKGSGKEKVKVRNLLTHSAGFPAFLPIYSDVQGYDRFLNAVCEIPLDYEPGTKTAYSDFSMILLGEIISRASARPLDRLLSDRLFGPLGMKSTLYRPPKKLLPRIAPTEDDPWRNRIVRGEVHDENAYAMGGIAGHAGLFSSAHDLAIFAQVMLNRGLYDHRRFFNQDTVLNFTSLQSAKEDGRGLGWGKPVAAKWTGEVFSPAAFGHTGFTGTLLWVDPERQLFIVLLNNRVHPSRASTLVEEARQTICESVIRAIDGNAQRKAGESKEREKN